MKKTKPSGKIGPIQRSSLDRGSHGIDIRTTTGLLRRYVCVERGLMRMLAGWFLVAPAYETKHTFGYHVWDHAEHVDWMRKRLGEMRGGQVNASVEPALSRCVDETIHAKDASDFISAAYLELQASLLECYRDHLAAADPCANAMESRLLQRMIPDLERHVEWAQKQTASSNDHRAMIRRLIAAAGGISGLETPVKSGDIPASPHRFQRSGTILFDSRIRRAELMSYEARKSASPETARLEDFKVFFNEMYAAALLASVIYDADPSELAWEFHHDFAHQFWDEVRHSEFGAIRLKELGSAPEVCNPVLFERSQGLPILHRICYLTLGLEVYFMSRKEPRTRGFAEKGDFRSQLFADQDWSDEITHVRYGKRWVDHLLENDFRTAEDILAEVREHMGAAAGQKQDKIAAPF